MNWLWQGLRPIKRSSANDISENSGPSWMNYRADSAKFPTAFTRTRVALLGT